jgi:uncharacterized RDD family membrane protein YckC
VDVASRNLPLRYAGFWIRVVAGVIDYLLMFAASFPVKLLFGSVATSIGLGAEMAMHDTLVMRRIVRLVVVVALVFAYRAGMESSSFQATLGKLAVRLKVTDLEGKRITFARATSRYFAKWLSALALGLGYLMVAFDEEKQGLHDRIARTLVLYRDRIG